jgi:hypothetical protein
MEDKVLDFSTIKHRENEEAEEYNFLPNHFPKSRKKVLENDNDSSKNSWFTKTA